MRIIWSLILGILPLFTIAQEPMWRAFSDEAGRFQVYAPDRMEEKLDTIETAVGQLVYHTFFYQPTDQQADNLLYLISYCDYPEGAMHSDSVDLVESFFLITLETARESLGGELIYSDESNYLDYPGKFWRIDYLQGEAVMKTRAFLIGSRYYCLQTATVKARSLNRSSDHFLNSFKWLEAKTDKKKSSQ
ncbi:MAG TPA: hypothetical protein PKA00_05370 [Saprospiraceae bacterium]|nr:hypothetical protein [Saprospiraceae bacterium]HMQ82312.1 hypothetical protein [Saprospiraceae bacterium]